MAEKITQTTDNKYLGETIEIVDGVIILSDTSFNIEKTQDLGSGYTRYSNSNYIITSKEYV